jgi:hypothetical protein
MSEYTVIRDVSETLRSLLEANLHQVNSVTIPVTVNSPRRVNVPSGHLLNLYLYQIQEDSFAKNRPPIPVGTTTQRRAPLALDLYYMMTPYVPDQSNDALDEHIVMGDAMRILYDNAVISGSLLQGALAHTATEIVIVICKTNLEEQTRIWNSLQSSHRLSVCYQARVVLVDSDDEIEGPRVLDEEIVYDQL